MIPIRDTTPTRHFPVVNNTLIGINIVVFLIQLAQGPEMDRFVYFYGLVPARYSVPQISAYFSLFQQLFAFISFMFLHGGFLHILFNMWSLYIFGDNVEDRLGSMRYLIFYLVCGIASGMSHLFLNWHSNVPTIGASGAIAGVMGAYFVLHPTSKILTLIPILIIPWFVEIPAFIFLGIWFMLQFLNAAATHGTASGIAWWAHIGGFVFGIVALKIFQFLPHTGIGEKINPVTEKKKTHRLQLIRPTGSSDSPHLYGSISITPYEAAHGSFKMVNVPWGFRNRLIRVGIPARMQEGKMLRLKGLGRQMPNGQRGDLLLRVEIKGRGI
jgi:membrane associated rhomboid family serine protease